jgi:hypothetical protein
LIIPGGAGTIGAVISEVSSFKFQVSSFREFLRVVVTSEARDLLLGAFLKSRLLEPNWALIMTIHRTLLELETRNLKLETTLLSRRQSPACAQWRNYG